MEVVMSSHSPRADSNQVETVTDWRAAGAMVAVLVLGVGLAAAKYKYDAHVA